MKKINLLIVSFLVSGILLAQKTINDPNAEPRNLSGFKSIKISNAFDVYISQGNEDAVAVSASKAEYREKIITRVENGVLTIRFDNDKKLFNWNTDRVKLKAYISVKDLEKLTVNGACDVFIEDGIKGDDLAMNVSGASSIKAKLEVDKLSISLSGASDMTLTGKATNVKLDVNGASNFKSLDLTTDYCDASASGASSISVTVNKELNAKASGASDVRFKGEGLIRDIRTSGASKVRRA